MAEPPAVWWSPSCGLMEASDDPPGYVVEPSPPLFWPSLPADAERLVPETTLAAETKRAEGWRDQVRLLLEAIHRGYEHGGGCNRPNCRCHYPSRICNHFEGDPDVPSRRWCCCCGWERAAHQGEQPPEDPGEGGAEPERRVTWTTSTTSGIDETHHGRVVGESIPGLADVMEDGRTGMAASWRIPLTALAALCNDLHVLWADDEAVDIHCTRPAGHDPTVPHRGDDYEWNDAGDCWPAPETEGA